MVIAVASVVFTGCKKDEDPVVNKVFYSEWITSTVWSGVSGAYYFDVAETKLTDDIINYGVVLGFTQLVGDYTNTRPLPAILSSSSVWNYHILSAGTLRFTTNVTGTPSTENKFRYVIIPGDVALKSTKNALNKEELMKMSYSEICLMFGIPE